ncbi:MAG: hypothetical protein ACYC7E_10605 [Armatimonadota bacterium]
MARRSMLLLIFLMAFILLATVAPAQEEEAQTMLTGYSTVPMVIKTIFAFAVYLLIYTIALIVPLSFLQRYTEFEVVYLFWVPILWLGGMGANYLAYLVTDHRLAAALIAMPLIFGWSMLINTRPWADLTARNALWVSLTLALVCAPYFGPTWHMKPPPKIETESVLPLGKSCRGMLYSHYVEHPTTHRCP